MEQIPLPIQGFLLSNTCSFLQSKKTRDNVCLTFERVLVQNILHGLPPTVCEAIQSTSRWNLVRFALPHVLHCAAAMIRLRLKSTIVEASGRDEKGRLTVKCNEPRPPLRFDQAETKLLYTLQWMLLDAAAECADNDPNFKRRSLKDRAYLHDLSTLQLFIYLFGPVFEKLRWEDFDTLKLESGLRLWMPILAFRQPYEGSFPVLVKPCGDVDISPLCTYVEQFGPVPEAFRHLDFESATGVLQFPPTTAECSGAGVAGIKSETPETLLTPVTSFYPTSPSLNIPNAESSDEETSWYDRNAPPVGVSGLRARDLKSAVPMAHLNEICPVSLKETDSSESSTSEAGNGNTWDHSHLDQSLEEQVAEFTQTVLKDLMATDTRMASHTDLAVIRCLFTAEWSESGAVWALQYIYRRLVFLRHESLQERLKRSVQSRLFHSRLPYYAHLCNDYTLSQGLEMGILRSLSTPQLSNFPPSCQQSMDAESVSSLQGQKKTQDISGQKSMFILGEGSGRLQNNSTLSQKSSSSELEGVLSVLSVDGVDLLAARDGHDFPGPSAGLPVDPSGEIGGGRPNDQNSGGLFSSRRKLKMDSAKSKRLAMSELKDRIARIGKSRGDAASPTFGGSSSVFEDGALSKSQSDDRGCTEVPGGSLLAVPRSEAGSRQADSGSLRNKGKPPHPKSACDLVELHGREESMLIQFKSQSSLIEKRGLGDLRDSSLNEDDSGINCSQISIEPGDFGPASPDIITSSQRSLIHRSYSDTNIAYNSIQLVEEVPGSNNYIDADGGINYSTLLTGIYWTSNLHSSLRICEHLLKNVYCLLDLCYINWNQETCKYKPKRPSGQTEKKCDDAVTAASMSSVSRLSAVQLPVKFDRLLKSRPSSRSKSVIAPNFLSTHASQHTPKRPHSRPRGSSAVLNRDGENSSERLDTLERSNRSSRRLPFNIGLGRQRQRKTAGAEEAAAGEAEADLSNDNESTDDESQPTAQTTRQPPHTQSQQQKQTRYRLRSTFLSHRKHADDKFVFSSDTSQVRFRTSPRSGRGVVGTGQHGSRRSMDRLSDSPSLLGASLLRLSSGQLAVEKRPRRVNMESRGTYNGNFGCRAASFRRDEKLSAQAAAKRQESVLNYCLIMEILVKIIRVLSCSHHRYGDGVQAELSHSINTENCTLGPRGEGGGTLKYFQMLRRHAHHCFLRMFHIDEHLFYCFFSRLVAACPITELMEFLHALTGFCLDPATIERQDDTPNYQNNFGQSYSGEGTRGAEGVIISNMMGPLLRRLVRCRKELATQENIGLFTEVRHLLGYLKTVHGNTFHRALLCALLCSVRTVMVKNKQPASTARPRLLSARNSLWPSTSTKRNSGFLSSVDPPDTSESFIGSFQAKRMGFLSSAVGSQFPKPRRLTDEAVNANMDVKAGKLVVERKLVDISALREDLLDFSFLLECSEPGSLPESELVASFLDLNAPVLARACLLLQCAYFVNKCNRGEWPAWIKMNFPMPVQQATHTNLQPPAQPIAISISGPAATSTVDVDNRGVRTQKNTAQIQWAAGRLFHSWAEALGIRIMEFLDNPANVTSSDAFLHRDFGYEENFLDDALVNASGDNCPYALLVLAVQLLMEITAFLRESHQHALRGGGGRNARGHSEVVVQSEGHGAQMSGRRSHTSGLSGHQAGVGAVGAASALKATRRRLSILMPLFGPMESKEKATPQGGNSYIELPDVRTENTETGVSTRIGEDIGSTANGHSNRQISFAFSDDQRGRCASLQGSLSSPDVPTEVMEKSSRISISKGSSKRSTRSGSFRQSFQFTSRSSKQEGSGHRMSIRITESKDQGAQSPCHESNIDDGLRSGLRPESARKRDRLNETDQDDIATSQLKRSPRRDRLKTSLSSTATPIGSRSRIHTPTDSCSTNMPWIPAVIKFAKLTNFSCRHQPTCQVNCFDRQQQQLRALLQAIRQVYSAPTETSFIASVDKLPEGRRLRSTPSAHTGPIWHQYSSDSTRTCEMQSVRSSPNNSSNNSAGSSEAENATGSDLRISEQDARGALKEACLRLGGAGFGDLGLDFGDSEPDVSTSILHRVFAATGVEGDKKNGLQVKAAKRKESSMLTTGWKEATTPIFDRFRRKGGHKRASAGPNGAAVYCGPEEGSLQAGQGGLSSLMNLSLLAGAGTGLAAAASSPSLARLLEFVKSGLGGASELEEGQSEDDMPRTKVRPPLQNADSPELVYLDTQVHSLRSSFFNLLNKSAILLTNEQLEDIIPLAWELLLEADPELTSSADPLHSVLATFILFAAVKCPNFVQKLVYTELHHADVNSRLNAVLRFRILWVNRHHVWSRLEEGAALCFKLPPPSIEYVLPSPTLGNPTVEVPDPAWKTRKGTSAEEVQLKQNEATKTFVTASTSRRKQQQELLARAVSAAKAQEDEARRAFHMTTCPVLELASIEAAFSKDHREEASVEDGTVGVTNSVVQEEFNLAARKVSFAPLNRSMNMQSRSFSWRNGSIPIFRDNVTLMDDDESPGGGLTLLCMHQFQMAQCFFPSCLCAAALPLTDLLDDCAVSREGTAISTVAQEVIWQCLTEDTSLFLRNIFEKLTRAPHKDELICILRKLVQRLPELPMQTAHILFNNLVGCIMFYVRTPNFDAPDSIASVLCILHMIVPFVKNIYFKDLKQTLRREQIDGTLLVTANLPCAKQFNVFDDRICVAQLVKLQDDNKDYRFSDILSEALETNSVPQSEHHLHVLCDDRSNIIRNSSHYVRDFYPFKRNHIPKLRLMRVDKETGQQLLQRNAFSLKVQEVGKVMLFKTILQTTPMSTMSNHLMFLHEELVKLPSFPRKALETEFALCDTGEMAKPLLAIDTIHKLTWCQLLNSMFQKMPSTFPWSSELQLFLNVYNGTLVLHAEDASILRHCMAFYLQCAYQFKMVFSVNGYLSILPTIIRVYHHNLHNGILTQAIEFTCKHFYIMHRTPFILQMFGCIANYIDLSQDDFSQQNFYRVLPETLYRLLRTIGRDSQDSLGILQLCNFSKPLKALDFCYADDSQGWSIFEAVNLCVTVQVYAPESYRSRQMMVILQAIVPFILRDLPAICSEECSTGDVRKFELQSIQQLSVTIKQLICTTEWMTRRVDDVRSVVSSQSSHGSAPGGPRASGTSVKHLADQAPKIPEWASALSGVNLVAQQTDAHAYDSEKGVSFRRRRHRGSMGLKRSASSILSKRTNQEAFAATAATSSNPTPSGWRKSSVEPREAILQIASEFLTVANIRLTELGERHRFSDLLDGKAYMRLSELAQSIIKQFPCNPNLLKSQALQRFLTEVLPIVEWGHESLRSCKALETLIGRLSRTLPKMLDTPSIRKQVKWDCVTSIIRSLYMTAQRNRSVAQLKEIKIFAEYLKRSVVVSPRTWCPSVQERPATTSGQMSFKREITDVSSGPGVVAGASYTAEVSTIGSEGSGRTVLSGAGVAPSGGGRGFSSGKRRSRVHTASFLGSSSTSNRETNRVGSTRANTERTLEQGSLPASFVSEAVKFITLLLNILGGSYRLKDLCERTTLELSRCPTILEDGIESLSNYLSFLILPILAHGSTEKTDFPSLSRENVFYALDTCLSALFVGVRKAGPPCTDGKQPSGTLNTAITSNAAATATSVVANAFSPDDVHGIGEGGTKKPLIPAGLILSSSKTPTFSALNELPMAGSIKAHFTVGLGSSVYPNAITTTPASSRLQALGVSGAGGLSWEPVCSASLACDLGAGRVHCSLVNLVSPTLHCLQQKSDPTVGDLVTSAGALPATTAAGGICMTGNSLISSNPTVKFVTPTESDPTGGSVESNQQTQVDLLHKLAFLGLKLILVVYSRHSMARVRQINAALAKLSFYRSCAVQLWKFVDFVVTCRPSIFVHLVPFIRFQMMNINCETQGEQAFQQIIGQKLLGLHVPPQPTIVSIVKGLLLDLRVLQEDKRMLSLMHRKSALHTQPRSALDSGFSPASLAETVGSPTGLRESAGVLQHTPEKHFGLIEGGQMRVFSQAEFRQSLLRRTSGRRITAYEGSRFLSQHKTLSQGKPILTASVESLPRQSGRSSMERQPRGAGKDRGMLRRAVTAAGLPAGSYNNLGYDSQRDYKAGSCPANRTKEPGPLLATNPLEEDELSAPANPLLAAAVATSLYGSAAPYTQVREKAREELDDLIGISPSPLEVSPACRQEKSGHFTSVVGFAGPINKDRITRQKYESIPLAGLSTQRHRDHFSVLPTPVLPDVPPSTATSDQATRSAGHTATTDGQNSDPKHSLLKQAKFQYV